MSHPSTTVINPAVTVDGFQGFITVTGGGTA